MGGILDGIVRNAEDVEADRLANGPLWKGKTRLEQKADVKPLTVVDEKKFRQEVITRDKGHCRCCLRKVVKTIAHVAERQEVHHIHGRRGDLRFDSRAALLLCLRCHQRVTGKVNDKLRIVASKTFTTPQGEFTDAREPVTFEKVA